jgi:hypothetical protein
VTSKFETGSIMRLSLKISTFQVSRLKIRYLPGYLKGLRPPPYNS